MDGQDVKGPAELTVEERRFIVDCLANVSLQGRAAGLRPVLAMMERIVAKLEGMEEGNLGELRGTLGTQGTPEEGKLSMKKGTQEIELP